MHVDDQEATTAAVVAELGAGAHPKARFLLGAPCVSVFVPLFVGYPLGEPPAWEQFDALTPDRRPALDRLERELEADALDDPRWNVEAWQRVAQFLASRPEA
jgi:hypothetical protein